MMDGLDTTDVKVVKVVTHYKTADEALESISERLARRSLAMQESNGTSVEDINRLAESKRLETQKTQKQYFSDEGTPITKQQSQELQQ